MLNIDEWLVYSVYRKEYRRLCITVRKKSYKANWLDHL